MIKNSQILDAAAEVLARRPDATLQAIAHGAGTSRTTIFNKYPTRDALLEALAVDALDRIGAVMAGVPHHFSSQEFADALLEVTVGLMPLGPRTAFLRRAPGGDSGLEQHWAHAVEPLAVYMAQAQAHGVLRRDHSVRWLVASYVGVLFAAWDEVAQGELGFVQAARLVVDTWLRGASE